MHTARSLRRVVFVSAGVLLALAPAAPGHADVVGTLVGQQQCDPQTDDVVVTITFTNLSGVDMVIDGYGGDATALTAGSVVDGNPAMDVEVVPPAGVSMGALRFSSDVAGTYSLPLFLIPDGGGSASVTADIVVVPDAVFCAPPTTTSPASSTSTPSIGVGAGAGGALPDTGRGSASLVAWSMAFVALGALLVTLRRRAV